MKKLRNIAKVVYNVFSNHPYIYLFIYTLLSVIFQFIQIGGKSVGIVKLDGTIKGIWLTIIFVLFAFVTLSVYLQVLASKLKNDRLFNAEKIYAYLLKHTNTIKKTKLTRFTKYISRNLKKKNCEPFHEITQPKDQILTVLNNFAETLLKITKVDNNLIGLSVLYKHNLGNTSKKWTLLRTENLNKDLTKKGLLNEKKTSAYHIINGFESFIFYPDKRVGIEEGKYHPGPSDNNFNNIGSIICKDISLTDTDSSEIITAACLSITTWGEQICTIEKKEEVEDMLKKNVLPTFEARLKLELSLLYIKEILAIEKRTPKNSSKKNIKVKN